MPFFYRVVCKSYDIPVKIRLEKRTALTKMSKKLLFSADYIYGMVSPFILALSVAAWCASPPAPPPKTVPFNFAPVLALLQGPAVDKIGLDQVTASPVTYTAWGVRTIARPARQVASVALDLPSYTKTFSNVHRCERITDPARLVSKTGTWYLEGRAFRVRILAIGDIDSLVYGPDSSSIRLFAHQNENRLLERKWLQALPRWMNYRTHALRLAAFVQARGPDSCSIGIMAQGWVKDPMPEWLTRMAIRYIMPNLFDDLEAEVERRFPVKRKHWFLWW